MIDQIIRTMADELIKIILYEIQKKQLIVAPYITLYLICSTYFHLILNFSDIFFC